MHSPLKPDPVKQVGLYLSDSIWAVMSPILGSYYNLALTEQSPALCIFLTLTQKLDIKQNNFSETTQSSPFISN